MVRESAIQKAIIKHLRQRGHYVYNTQGSATSSSGTPDLLCCIHGKFVALEVKRPHGSYGTTAKQVVTMRKIDRAGGYATTVTNIEEVDNVIEICKRSR